MEWKLHNTETGGFFRCNRWIDESEHVKNYDENQVDDSAERLSSTADLNHYEGVFRTAESESRAARKRSKEMTRFIHHYERWHGHKQSSSLECIMADTVVSRLAPVVREAIEITGSSLVFGGKGLSFLHAAFVELLECRSVLQHSYAFSFFRFKPDSIFRYSQMRQQDLEKAEFERAQSELEVMTEQVSDLVARSHIRATQTQIAFLTNVTARKREEFSKVMIKILSTERNEEIERKREDQGEGRRRRHDEYGQRPCLFGSIRGMADDFTFRSERVASGLVDEVVRESLERYLATVAAARGFLDCANDSNEEESSWPCSACTYVNVGRDRRCDMCATERYNIA